MGPFDPLDLLRRLGSGVRPAGRGGVRAAGVDGFDFAGLVAAARRGVVRSGRVVDAGGADGLGLSEGELGWLSAALDAAEAAGGRYLVAQVRGWVLGLDIAGRRVDAAREAGSGIVVTNAEMVALVDGDACDADALWGGWAGAHRGAPVARAEALRDAGPDAGGGTDCAVLGLVAGNASLADVLAVAANGVSRGGEGD